MNSEYQSHFPHPDPHYSSGFDRGDAYYGDRYDT